MIKAANFSIKDTEKNVIKLSQYLGDKNVVLLFFPFAFSGVCTKELCNTRDNLKMFNSFDAEVIGISVDSIFTLKAFKETNNINFTLLSDFNKEVSNTYEVLYEDYKGMKGVSKRSVFVINKKGEIVYSEILEDADDMLNFEKVQQTLALLS